MFLVLTRNPHRVDKLSFFTRRIPTVETSCIKKRRKENKNKKIKRSASLSCLIGYMRPIFFLFYILILFYFIIIIIIILWIHSSYYFIRVHFYLENFYFFSVHFILNELSPHHFLTSEIFVQISSLKSLVTYHPENHKIFRWSQNLTKLFWVTRFRETNSMAQFVSSSEI